MESNYELKYQLNIACYIFNDIIKIEDFDLDNVLIDEESIENISVFKISFKCLIDSKRLRISFDKMDEFIRVYDGTRYFVLYGSKKYGFIYNKFRCLIAAKSGIA